MHTSVLESKVSHSNSWVESFSSLGHDQFRDLKLWLLVVTSASSDEHLVGTKHGSRECRSVRRKTSGEQWSRRETIEARGTKGNFDVEMDSGISGPPVTSRRDEGMPTATAPMEIPTEPPPAPPPEEHVPEIRGQGVHAKALRIRAFCQKSAGYPA